MSYAQAAHGHAPAKPAAHAPAPAQPTHTHVEVKDVKPGTSHSVWSNIWAADQHRIHPFHETRFPKEYKGDFVVKICDAPDRRRADLVRDHKVFQLYKWHADTKSYKLSSNKELCADPKYKGYKLVYDLFDNYESDETKPEVNTAAECKEIMDFLNYVADSEPVKVAAAYLREKFSSSSAMDRDDKESFSNRAKFVNKLKKIWFDQYDWGAMKSLSGFEHTFVGERRASGEVMGYHFWYKYYVDDSDENVTHADTIDFKSRLDSKATDDFISIRFAEYVDADGDGKVDGKNDAQLYKSCGSFFVGCSAECKIALGTIAYYESKSAWAARRANREAHDQGHDEEGVEALINGFNYKLSMHRGGDKHQYCRTFFPEISPKH